MRRWFSVVSVGLISFTACDNSSESATDEESLGTDVTTDLVPSTTVTTQPEATTPDPTTTTTTTTTTSATVADTTVTTSEPEAPASNPDVIDFEPLYAEAFAGFEAGWNAQRVAYQDPTAPVDFTQYYTGEALSQVEAQLDEVVASRWIVLPPDDAQRIEFVAGLGGNVNFAIIQICQVLTESIVEADTGEVVYEGSDASIIEATVVLTNSVWKVQSQPRLNTAPDSTDCSDL